MKQTKGFTLIELSIVLIILALISTGILAGKELVQSAKINATMAEFQKYDVAIASFSLKYGALPGDMSSTTRYWPDLRDGNGNGKILWYDNQENLYEGSIAWSSLERARMVEIELPANYGEKGIPGVNIPYAKLGEQAGWSIGLNTDTQYNVLFLGAESSSSNTALAGGPVLETTDAKKMDGKLDDGYPRSGRFYATGNACNSGNEYRLDLEGLRCSVDIAISNNE